MTTTRKVYALHTHILQRLTDDGEIFRKRAGTFARTNAFLAMSSLSITHTRANRARRRVYNLFRPLSNKRQARTYTVFDCDILELSCAALSPAYLQL